MRLKQIFALLFVVILALNLTSCGKKELANEFMKLEKNEFKPREQIQLTFTVPDTVHSSAWIGIIPSNVTHGSESENDKYDVAYQYLQGQKTGTLIFKAPESAGDYNFRLNSSDENGIEMGYLHFVVK